MGWPKLNKNLDFVLKRAVLFIFIMNFQDNSTNLFFNLGYQQAC